MRLMIYHGCEGMRGKGRVIGDGLRRGKATGRVGEDKAMLQSLAVVDGRRVGGWLGRGSFGYLWGRAVGSGARPQAEPVKHAVKLPCSNASYLSMVFVHRSGQSKP